MTIIHFVMLQMKPGTEQAIIDDLCARFLDLKTKCVLASTQKPYIKSIIGGKNNSPEAAKVDFSHGFIVEFETEEDRKYYLEKDEAHLKFAKGLAVAVQEVGILDFEPGVY